MEGPVGLDEFMALLRAKNILPTLATEAEALEAFRRNATNSGGGAYGQDRRGSENRLGVEECKRAVKELLASKNMLSRHASCLAASTCAFHVIAAVLELRGGSECSAHTAPTMPEVCN